MWCSREVRECSFTECWSTQMLMLLLSAFAVSWRKKTNGIDVWKCTRDGTTKRCEVRENCPQLQRIIYFNNLQYCYYITIKVTHVCTSPIRTWYLILPSLLALWLRRWRWRRRRRWPRRRPSRRELLLFLPPSLNITKFLESSEYCLELSRVSWRYSIEIELLLVGYVNNNMYVIHTNYHMQKQFVHTLIKTMSKHFYLSLHV